MTSLASFAARTTIVTSAIAVLVSAARLLFGWDPPAERRRKLLAHIARATDIPDDLYRSIRDDPDPIRAAREALAQEKWATETRVALRGALSHVE